MLATELLTLEERPAARSYARGLALGHTDVNTHKPRHRAGEDSCTRLWWQPQSRKLPHLSRLRWLSQLNPCFILDVCHYVNVTLPGKLFLSKFIMGKVSSKCRRGSLLPTYDYIKMNNWLLSPGVTPKPQKKIRVDYYAPHSTQTIKISFDRKLNPKNWS